MRLSIACPRCTPRCEFLTCVVSGPAPSRKEYAGILETAAHLLVERWNAHHQKRKFRGKQKARA